MQPNLFRMEGGGGFVWWWFHKLAMQQCLTARSQNPDFFNHCSTVKPNFNIHNSTKYLGFNSHCFLRGSSYECHKPTCLQVVIHKSIIKTLLNYDVCFLLFLNSILQCIGIKITTRILHHMIKINIYLNMKNLHILSIINI
jgi:hypothetical protein